LANLEKDDTIVYKDAPLSYCGYGSTANHPTPSKGLTCTELDATLAETCSANTGIHCTLWENKDNNVCQGDFGGPLYLNIPGKPPTQRVIGIATWAPKYAHNAPCTDGHATEFSKSSAIQTWLDSLAAAKMISTKFLLKK
jgi:hypothetical protein